MSPKREQPTAVSAEKPGCVLQPHPVSSSQSISPHPLLQRRQSIPPNVSPAQPPATKPAAARPAAVRPRAKGAVPWRSASEKTSHPGPWISLSYQALHAQSQPGRYTSLAQQHYSLLRASPYSPGASLRAVSWRTLRGPHELQARAVGHLPSGRWEDQRPAQANRHRRCSPRLRRARVGESEPSACSNYLQELFPSREPASHTVYPGPALTSYVAVRCGSFVGFSAQQRAGQLRSAPGRCNAPNTCSPAVVLDHAEARRHR